MDKIKFKMAILRSGYTQVRLAKELGISKNALSNKVNGHTSITADEAIKMCDILGITSNEEKAQIFLTRTSR